MEQVLEARLSALVVLWASSLFDCDGEGTFPLTFFHSFPDLPWPCDAQLWTSFDELEKIFPWLGNLSTDR